MGGFESGLVHRALHPGGEGLIGDLAVDRRAAGMAGERDGQYVVTALEGGENKLPAAPRVTQAVYADQRGSRAAAVRGGEGGVHAARP